MLSQKAGLGETAGKRGRVRPPCWPPHPLPRLIALGARQRGLAAEEDEKARGSPALLHPRGARGALLPPGVVVLAWDPARFTRESGAGFFAHCS